VKFNDPNMRNVYFAFSTDMAADYPDYQKAAFQRGLSGGSATFDMTPMAYAAWQAGHDLRRHQRRHLISGPERIK
jgi:hypothetical protein